MTVDLTSTEHFLLTTAGLVLTACVPLVSLWLRSHLRAAKGSALSTDLDNAVSAAARLALDSITSVAEHNRTVELHNSAVGMGVQYVIAAAQGAVASLRLTPTHVAAMVSGEVAKALGTKPQTASATSPAASTSPEQKAS